MSDANINKVIIIGSGPAGYAAAIYSARAILSPLMITGIDFGGQLMKTSKIENYPGCESIEGGELMEIFHSQANEFGTNFLCGNVTSIDLLQKPFSITTSDNTKHLTQSIIIATGAKALWLDADGEKELQGRGISTCGVCDGACYRDEHVVVIGGGDSAMENALFLTKYASSVTIISRNSKFRASKFMMSKVVTNTKIKLIYPYKVDKWVSKDNNLTNVIISNTICPDIKKDIPCTGGFICIGHKPCTDFLEGSGVELDKDGYIVTYKNTMTSVEGVFACGDVVDKHYKQAITAAGDGCKASIDCNAWLEKIS